MVYQRISKSSSRNSPSQEKSSQFAPRPFAVQARHDSHRPSTRQEIENDAFDQNKFEAFGLQLKKEGGTIKPVEQERLGVLQAELADFRAQRLERASRFGHNFADMPVHAPGQEVSAPVQPRLGIQPLRAGVPPQSSRPAVTSKLVGDRAIRARGDTAGDPLASGVELRPNKTGLPADLKAGVENLSGYSLDEVRVRYNSPKPPQLQALAYTQGTEIHVASGREEHLPHEAWHVVQQMQGRVKPTMQMKGTQINDDEGLEKEADVMGQRALQGKTDIPSEVLIQTNLAGGKDLIQRVVVNVGFDNTATQSMFAGPGNELTTSDVGNCIVVVVWDTGGQGAVMRHYDTINAYQGTTQDPVSGGAAFTWNVGAFIALRQQMIDDLGAHIAPLGHNFAISLGGVWSNVDQQSPVWLGRMNLIRAIVQVFGVEPVAAGSTATFDTTTNTFT
jgi:hypothetical protein